MAARRAVSDPESVGETLGGEPASPQPTARRGSRGASLVEFALLLPVFAMLLFGGITTGLALNEKQQMTHATREGARYAATVPPSQDFDNGESWAENVRDLIVERSVGTLVDSDICVSLVHKSPGEVYEITTAPAKAKSHFTTDSSGTSPCIANQPYPISSGDDGLRVQVTASKPAEIDLILFGNFTVTLETEATGHSESN